jgi:ribose transport system permease protein
MAESKLHPVLSRFLTDYGMSVVLLLLCLYYSVATIAEQDPTGADGGAQLARIVVGRVGHTGKVLIVTRDTQEDAAFADVLRRQLSAAGVTIVAEVRGSPAEARATLERLAKSGEKLDAIAANQAAGGWAILENVGTRFPALGTVPVLTPQRYRWPNFLKADNLLNVANQIVVIAILAIGMTFVVITGGIDLSVGSLVALSAVTATVLIRDWAGAHSATSGGMIVCCLAAVLLCSLVGLFSGVMVTFFQVPPFIVTLSMLLVASGLADELSKEQSVYQLPDRFDWLGLGTGLFGIPNGVVLMAVLYMAAHIVMSRTTLGRYVYAVGGNREAARLSGVPVARVLLLVYVLSGALAALGGILLASQLKSGSPTYGQMYEMYVIAAVVVGGASLSGGEGKIFGTLIGAFIIAVIRNGMNLTGVESRLQKIVFGLVILGAVLLDRFKKYDLPLRRWLVRLAKALSGQQQIGDPPLPG